MTIYMRGSGNTKENYLFDYLMKQEFERLQGADWSLVTVAKRHRCSLNPISEQDWTKIHNNREFVAFVQTSEQYHTEDYDNRIDYRGNIRASYLKIAILVEVLRNTTDFWSAGERCGTPVNDEAKIVISLLMALHILKNIDGP